MSITTLHFLWMGSKNKQGTMNYTQKLRYKQNNQTWKKQKQTQFSNHKILSKLSILLSKSSHLLSHDSSMIFLGLVPTLTRTINGLELIFRDTFTHGGGTGYTARDHFE
jgi:hypothetical protein